MILHKSSLVLYSYNNFSLYLICYNIQFRDYVIKQTKFNYKYYLLKIIYIVLTKFSTF